MLRSDLILSARFTRELIESLPLDAAFVSSKALEGSRMRPSWPRSERFWASLSTKLKAIADQLAKALAEADSAVAGTKSRWDEKRKVIEEIYESSCESFRNRRSTGPSSSVYGNRLKNYAL